MQNAAFGHLGLDCCYIPFAVNPDFLGQAVESVRALALLGANLTIPHKESVLPFLDRIDEEAAAIGAVNTIVNTKGTLTGYNTDGQGFMRCLDENSVSPAGKQILIMGAGGSSRAIGYYLAKEAESLCLHNRTRSKSETLAAYLSSKGGAVKVIDSLDDLKRFDIIINATSLGLKSSDPLPLDTSSLISSQVVCDLIYRSTALLSRADARGCRTIGGAGMLLWQGALAFELWTGLAAPVEIMRTALLGSQA